MYLSTEAVDKALEPGHLLLLRLVLALQRPELIQQTIQYQYNH